MVEWCDAPPLQGCRGVVARDRSFVPLVRAAWAVMACLDSGKERAYRMDVYDEVKMAFSHRVGRSLCFTMCTGLGLFLFAVGLATALSETRDPCPLEVVETEAPAPPTLDLGALGDGTLACTTPPVQVVSPTCLRNDTTVAGDTCEDFVLGEVACPDSCVYEDPEDVSGTGFIVFSQQPVTARFPAWSSSGPSNFICVGWDGDSWVTLAPAERGIGTNRAFSPAASDVLVASYRGSEFATARGELQYVGGTGAEDRQILGYRSGDLAVTVAGAVPSFDLNGTHIVPHPPAVQPAPPPPPCHAVPPGGASSIGWFAFGGAILLMAIMIGGLRGGCKYEEVEMEKSQESVVITITRRACMCIEAFRCQKCILRESVHTLSSDVEAAQCDYEADGGVCSGAIHCGKSVVVANNFYENADGSITQGLDVESTVQVWNGPPLSMSASQRLQKQINKFLNPDYVETRERIKFDGPEWKGTPRRDIDAPARGADGHASPPKSRRPRTPTRTASSFGSHLRQPPRLPVEIREQRLQQQQQVKIANNDTLLGDLQQARDVQAQLLELRRQTIANGRPMTTELDMLLQNMEDNMKQIEAKLRLSGQEVPLNRSTSLTHAPMPPPGDAYLNARPQALHQMPGSSASTFPSQPSRGDTGAQMELVPAGSPAVSLGRSTTQFEHNVADGLAGIATAEVEERSGGERPVDNVDVTDQRDDASDSSAPEDHASQEQAQLLAAPARSASTTEAVKLQAADDSQSTVRALAPLKASSIGGTASMLARLSAFKAQKAAAIVAEPPSESPEEELNDEHNLAGPAASDDSDTAPQPQDSMPVREDSTGAAVDTQGTAEQGGTSGTGAARGEEIAETTDAQQKATTADASTPIRPTTPPARGQEAGAKSEAAQKVALAKKRAEVQRRKKLEAAKKKKAQAAAAVPDQPDQPEQDGSDLPGGNHADSTPASVLADAGEEDGGERPAEATDGAQTKRTDIAAAVAARKKAASKKAALSSKSKRDDTKARILAAKARKAKEAAAQAKPDTAP